MSDFVRNLIVTVLIFAIVVVGITLVMIVKKNNADTKVNSGIKTVEEGIDLYGTYDQNDILIKDKVSIYKDLKITVPVIEGLKDKEIEQKINNSIELKIMDLVDEAGFSGDVEVGSHYDNMSNFANVISLTYDIYNDDFSKWNGIYLNYNLVNGNEIKFEELFTSSNDVLDIVKKGIYEGMVLQTNSGALYGEDTETEEFFDDNMYMNEVKSFMNNKDRQYYFTPSYVYFKTDKIATEIDFMDIADKVAIYNRFLTNKSIYERDDIGYKGVFTCVDTVSYNNFNSIEYGFMEKNFWYDISSFGNTSSYLESFMSGDIIKNLNDIRSGEVNNIKDEVEKYHEIAKNNKDRVYIFLAKSSVSLYNKGSYDAELNSFTYKFSDLANVSNINYIYEMPKDVFDEVYKDELIESYRTKYFGMLDGAYIDVGSGDNVDFKKEETAKVINVKTNKEIKSLSDVFYEDSNYMDIIENKIKEKLIENGVTEDELDSYMDSVEYEVDAFGVNIKIPKLKFLNFTISYDDFDESIFKLWTK